MAKSPVAILFDTAGTEKGVVANPVIVQGLGFGAQERQAFTDSSYVLVTHGLDGYPLKITVLSEPPGGSVGAFGLGGFGEYGFGETGGEQEALLQVLGSSAYSVRYVDENQFIVAFTENRTGVILYEV